uniref:LBH domain-containing protein n=1 Tax=Amphilophus citrinellus TaxID=61819 RepID=A0A3Q0TCH0_AMPCI
FFCIIVGSLPHDIKHKESDYPQDFVYRRERLPSIVVEPTDPSEQESGELCWPLGHPMSNSVEEEEDDNRSHSNTYH